MTAQYSALPMTYTHIWQARWTRTKTAPAAQRATFRVSVGLGAAIENERAELSWTL